jgi:hypothetical protein
MKRISEMVKAEVLALSNEQIEQLIDYECAIEGVPLLPPIPVIPEKPDIKPDVTVFEIGGFFVLTNEEATRILEAVDGCEIYESVYVSSLSYEKMIKPVSSPAGITTKKFYSPEYWDKIKNIQTVYTEAKKIYDSKSEEYSSASQLRSNISAEVWGIVHAFQEEENQIKRYTAEFNRYLELAEGNRSIAMNFLTKAYPKITDFPDLIEELKKEVGD